jgi:hypothetical protein
MKTMFLGAAMSLLILGGAYAKPVGSDAHVIQRSDVTQISEVTAPASNGRTLATLRSIQAGGPQTENPTGMTRPPSSEMRQDGSGLMINGLLPAENWRI